MNYRHGAAAAANCGEHVQDRARRAKERHDRACWFGLGFAAGAAFITTVVTALTKMGV